MADAPPPSLSELMRMVAELQQANQRIADENQIMAAQIAELNHVRTEHNDAHHQQPEDDEHHSPSHVSETIRADVIHPEDEKEGTDDLVGPFTKEVMNFELPKRFTLPLTLTPYDGLGDPKKFLKKFRSIMIVNGASDTVLCRCFSNYLDGPALDWLCALPAGSVSRFQQLAKLFEEHFTGSAIYLHDSDYLNTIKQGQNESLKDYMTRFTKIAISIPDLHPEVHLHALKSGLRPGKFQETIAIAKPKTLVDSGKKQKDKSISRSSDKLGSLIEQPTETTIKLQLLGKAISISTSEVTSKNVPYLPGPKTHLNNYRGKEKVSANNYEKPRGIINYILGGYASGGSSNSARKRSFRSICSLDGPQSDTQNPTQLPQLTFTQADYISSIQNLDDPVVITLQLGDLLVKKVLLDPGSSADVLFYSTFQKMKLSNNILQSTGGDLVGFSGERVPIIGSVWLQTTLGEHPFSKTCDIKFLVVDCFSPYNIILGRPFLNKFGAIVSTVHLCVKFPLQDDHVITIHGDHKDARQCYNIGMKFQNNSKQQVNSVDLTNKSSAIVDLDPRADFRERPTPSDDLQKVYFNNDPNKFTFVGRSISKEELKAITTFLQDQADLFACKPSDMPGIDPQIISHKLAINSSTKSVQQKKRKLGDKKRKASLEETQKLINVEFIEEIRFTTWLANVVMVRKQNGKWRMCVDFTDLNKACPKDSYPLPSIDSLVDNASGYATLSFMDAYSGYNQMLMHPSDQCKTAFITDFGNYYYKVMPFGLKNAEATYQRLMDKVFAKQIGRNIEVYVNDMVAKIKVGNNHLDDLTEIFAQIRHYNMRLNPEKCAFCVQGGKFLEFLLTNRGIEANPDKCRAVLKMTSPKTVKEVQRLTGRLAALSRFFLADFIAELTIPSEEDHTKQWTLYIDGSSNKEGCGAGIRLEAEDGTVLEHSLHLSFKASNNQSEYEALVARLQLCLEFQIYTIKVYCDSLLVVQQRPSEMSKGSEDKPPSLRYLTEPLYRRGYTRPLLKCLSRSEAEIALSEAHEGICGTHTGARSLSSKILRAGFFWPSLKQDSENKVRACINCQKHAPTIHIPAEDMHHNDVTWPFHQWGLDILGPFPTAPGQVKFLIVAIDYFSKWIEAQPLAKITSQQMISFVWKNIICHFGIPHHIITDNGCQFVDQKFQSFLQNLKVKQHFASVEHPQTNGLAETANKVILHALKKKLDDAKGLWADLIPEVLWGYNTTPQSSTKETPFRLVYGFEAMIPLEISQSSIRTQLVDHNEARRTELDII
ncbi:uncharacterized protein [Arachis hypogaea]|uniref:uncharacterized protein n=1 Tax=Arachis hypogaea TaxID=3818 RepID=UPI003B2266FC